MDFVAPQPERAVQLLGQVDRQLAAAEVAAVAGDDRLRTYLPCGFMEDGVLEIGELQLHGRGEDGPVDGRDLEDGQKLADLPARALGTQRLAQ